MPEVRFSRPAEADIAELASFSAQRFGKDQTRLYARGLRAACWRLGDFPNMGPFHRRIDPPARVLTYRSHRIFYRVEGDLLRILRILHHARDTPTSV